MYKSRNIMSLLRDMKLMLRDKSVDWSFFMSRNIIWMFAT